MVWAKPAVIAIGLGALEFAGWIGASKLYDDYIQPLMEDAMEYLPLGDESTQIEGELDTALLMDILKTNQALLKYHSVREDIYLPLNVDVT